MAFSADYSLKIDIFNRISGLIFFFFWLTLIFEHIQNARAIAHQKQKGKVFKIDLFDKNM